MIRFSRAAAVAFVVIAFIVLGLTRFKCALFQVQATGGLPSLKYSGSQHLGEQDLGDAAECPVVLANTGGAPLRIFDIVTNCSCTGFERKVGDRFERAHELVVASQSEVEVYVRTRSGVMEPVQLRT